jgi:hypothetical protein
LVIRHALILAENPLEIKEQQADYLAREEEDTVQAPIQRMDTRISFLDPVPFGPPAC